MALKAWQIAAMPGLLFLFALYYDEISAFFTASAEEAASTGQGARLRGGAIGPHGLGR